MNCFFRFSPWKAGNCRSLLAVCALAMAWWACSTATLAQQAVEDFSEQAFFGNTTDQLRQATPPEAMRLADGFRAELLYTVPLETQGSWVCLTTDPQGRLIASAQWGGLYRITPPPRESSSKTIKVERINVDIGNAQGLLYANDSLYVVMSSDDSGLYRVRDTDGDDQFDDVQLLRRFEGDGEHGPHAVILAPDGQALYVVGGNGSYPTKHPENSLVPRPWHEDRLLRRMGASDGAFEKHRPGAWICRTDFAGQTFELVAMGLRNPYDIAFNPAGELFTFDSDMEWDEGTPWYRPTRVNHVISGADFGWRAGTAKWPDYYFDSFGSVVDVGFSSPTGITFGTGADFPDRYRQALFIADWSLGNIYAVHLTAAGASYRGQLERFVTAAPLPVTDVVIHPHDGAMYFTTGGRGITSALYRVTYVGDRTAEGSLDQSASDRQHSRHAARDRRLRQRLERFHGRHASQAIHVAWPFLAHPDRAIRLAARVAVEHQPVEQWEQRVFLETNPRAQIAALGALARHGDQWHAPLISLALRQFNWETLSHEDRQDLLRATMILLARTHDSDSYLGGDVVAQFDQYFPSANPQLDRDLAEILAFVEAPGIVPRLLAALDAARTQEEQIHFAICLRDVKRGWNSKYRRQYFAWFARAATQGGGVSFSQYMEQLRVEVTERLTESEKAELGELLDTPQRPDPYASLKQRSLVKQWTVGDLLPLLGGRQLRGDPQRGEQIFAAAACYRCHRFRGQGGVTGPDLTGVARRFQTRDILEAIVEPSRVVSDQYKAVQLVMNDGRVLSGKIRDQSGNVLLIMKDPANPADLSIVQRDEIDELTWSETSLMPSGLLDTFTEQEIGDLLAFLRESAP